MPCFVNNTMSICVPTWGRVWQPVHECPTCKTKRRMLARYQEWYGTTFICLTCGDGWQDDGERLERPFARGWRVESVRRAREAWAAYKGRT